LLKTTRADRNLEAKISADTEQLRANLAALEQELERSHARLREGHEAIADLERRQAEAAGSVAVAERAINEIEQRLVEQREALARLERVNVARRQLAVRIGERDAAASDVADTVDELLTQLEKLAAARETVTAARADFRALAGRSGLDDVPPEPAALRESWERLIEHIRTELGAELENDLVEAAARSPLGTAIDDLPVHLRALATERRTALLKRHTTREDEPTRIRVARPPTA
jgi:chromosome segregation ATPase